MTLLARTNAISTPFGAATCRLDAEGALVELKLAPAHGEVIQPLTATAAAVRQQLAEYFAGTRREFTLPLNPEGTEFQRRVWDELTRIPYGTTISYSELARRLGDPAAVRAVGRANGANPLWIIIPCHRVIGADGSLTGYAGGLEVKRSLLELEGALPPRLF